MASEPATAASLPQSYRLEEVTLRVQRQPGHGQPMQLLMVAGTGSATLQTGPQPVARRFAVPAAEVVALLNGLYRLRFFELPAVLRARASVFVQPDGVVGTQMTRLLDATSGTVCFTLPSYEKCVRYTEGEAPQELEAWVRSAFADAQRRTQPALPAK